MQNCTCLRLGLPQLVPQRRRRMHQVLRRLLPLFLAGHRLPLSRRLPLALLQLLLQRLVLRAALSK